MVKQEPVSVNWQTLFVIIPIVDLWASYRIQKLRMFLLIFLVGFGGASIIIEITMAGGIDSFDQDMDSFPGMMPVYIALMVAQFALAIILIRKWSKEWNAKFSRL